MKVLSIIVLIGAAVACQAFSVNNSPFVPLKDYYKEHKLSGRIISGEKAKRGQFPWQAAVEMTLSGGGAFCGGSLISPEWILTAAHCATEDVIYWKISLGMYNLNLWNDPDKVSFTTRDGFHHEDYNDYLNNDIALIKLPQAVTLTDTIQPIRLPSRSDVNNPLENIQVTVSGFGKTSDNGGVSQSLNFVELTTISNRKCAEVYGSQVIISSTLCAVGHPEQSTCNGDSGGPLIIKDSNGTPTQIGVVSFVNAAGCASGNPSGYVRTASFLDWISEKTGIPL